MAVEVYLMFNGNCREAVEFYSKVFKTEEPNISTFGESPQDPNYPMPEEAKNLIMHANLNIAGSRVMFSDSWPGSPYVVGNNVTVALVSEDEALIRSAYEGLKEGGTVNMELQETFWSKAFGMVKDKFGVLWQISLESGE